MVNVKSSSLFVLFCAYLVLLQRTRSTYMICTNICKYSHIHNLKENRQQQQKKIHKRKNEQMSALLFLWPSMLRTVKMTRCLQLSSYLTYTVTKWSRNKSRHHLGWTNLVHTIIIPSWNLLWSKILLRSPFEILVL